MEEDTTEQKQNYLRNEIIEKGYDPEEFSSYISNIKGEEGIDLALWSMEELEKIVKEFQQKQKPDLSKNANEEYKNGYIEKQQEQQIKENKDDKTLNETQKEEKKDTEKDNNIINNDNNNNVINNENKHNSNVTNNNDLLPNNKGIFNSEQNTIEKEKEKVTESFEDFLLSQDSNLISNNTNNITYNFDNDYSSKKIIPQHDIIVCHKEIKTSISDLSKLKILISSPELIKNGLFSFSYYQFTLTCKELNLSTKRKFNDFEWLHSKITQLYPSLYVPPLLQMKFFQKNTDAKWSKRVYYMQKWLDSIIKTPVIRSSQLFYDFISVPKEEFKTIRINYDKKESPKSLANFTTAEGILDITITPFLDTQASRIQGDINKKVFLYNKLKYSLKELMAEMEIMISKINNVSNLFHLLSQVYKESDAIEHDKMNKGFVHITNVFRDWAKGYQNQIEFFTYEMKYYFKYMSKELTEFVDIVMEYKNARNAYMDLKAKEGKNVKEKEIIGKYYGFYMNKAVEEYERLHKVQFKRMKCHFEMIEERKSDFILDYSHFVRLMSFKL